MLMLMLAKEEDRDVIVMLMIILMLAKEDDSDVIVMLMIILMLAKEEDKDVSDPDDNDYVDACQRG